MKKTILFAITSLFAFQMAMAKDVITKDVEKLPQPAKELINKYFPDEKISYIEIDEELLTTTYDVVFVSGTEIEFIRDGELKEIDTKFTTVPDALIPPAILRYVKSNFSESNITKIEKKKRTYEIELSNHLDLEFDKDGNFLRIDD